MKPILFFLIVFIPFFIADAQQKKERFRDQQSKIEELEKVKLIETLQMDEETSLRFFSRRNEHRVKVKEINDNLDLLLKEIEDKVRSSQDGNDSELKKQVDDYILLHQKLTDERKRFLLSLNDILSAKQIASLTLFERRFKEEIRDVLIKKRRRDFK